MEKGLSRQSNVDEAHTKSQILDKGIEVIKDTSTVHMRSVKVLCYNWSTGFIMGT